MGMFKHVWSRSYNRHVTHKDVYKLRQLVNACSPNEPANPGYSRVILAGLQLITIAVNFHAPEFEAIKRLVILAGTQLLEKDWPL